MKVTPKQYAVLLYDMTKDKEESTVKKTVKTFVELLARNRALSFLPRIERAYVQYYNVQEGVIDVKVTTAREISKAVAATLRSPHGGLKTAATFTIDSSVLGGARIQVGDYMIDDTLKSRLTRLTQHLYGNL